MIDCDEVTKSPNLRNDGYYEPMNTQRVLNASDHELERLHISHTLLHAISLFYWLQERLQDWRTRSSAVSI